MAHKIMYGLQKGGVGKTSSTVSTAEILAAAGYKVLVVDLDSQGNATKMLTGESIYKHTGNTIMEAILEVDAEPYILAVKEGLDLIPAEDHLAAFSRYVYTQKVVKPSEVLKRLLEPIESRYDFVFVDVGPTLGDTVINALIYADYIIVPVELGELAMDAMVRMLQFVEDAKKEGHNAADVLGIVLTMKDGRVKNEREIGEAIRAGYGTLVFDSEIRRRARIKEIPSKGVDLTDAAMEDYIVLVDEIITRIKQRGAHT